MKTKHRKDAHAKHRLRADPGAFFRVMARVQPFTQPEQTSLTLPLRVSWQSLCTGQGTEEDFHNLACCANVCLLRAEEIDPLLVVPVQHAQDALMHMLDRAQRLGHWGTDHLSREHIPPLLDLYEQLIALSTPQQMHTAMQAVMLRMQRGQTIPQP